MSVSADEINYLIYLYLQECGFCHSAFVFSNESLVTRSSVTQLHTPPGALISFIQKGLEMIEIEQAIGDKDSDMNSSVSKFPLFCDNIHRAITRKATRVNPQPLPPMPDPDARDSRSSPSQSSDSPSDPSILKLECCGGQVLCCDSTSGAQLSSFVCGCVIKLILLTLCSGSNGSLYLWERVTPETDSNSGCDNFETGNGISSIVKSVCDDMVRQVEGSSIQSSDSSWRFMELKSDVSTMKRKRDDDDDPSFDKNSIISVKYSHDLGVIASVSSSGKLKLNHLSRGGSSSSSHHHHHSSSATCLTWQDHPISSSVSSSWLISGGCDGRVVGSMMTSAAVSQTVEFLAHDGPVIDVSWRPGSSSVFASCCQGGQVCLWDINLSCRYPKGSLSWKNSQPNLTRTGPIAWLVGHDDDVNCLRWNSSSSCLASCSDDCEVKIFKISTDEDLRRRVKVSSATRDYPYVADEIEAEVLSRRPSNSSVNDDDANLRDSNNKRKLTHSFEIDPVMTLGEHLKPVYSIDWSCMNDNQLASGSFDTSIKVWDVEVGKSMMTMISSSPVYCLRFSPCGSFIAASYHDSTVKLWSVRDCECIKTWPMKPDGCVNDLIWGDDRNLLACHSSGYVGLIRL